MIKIENYEGLGWRAAIRGMRNPRNSWDRSDSLFLPLNYCDEDRNFELAEVCGGYAPIIGTNDHKLMLKLAKGGSVHAKYRRMIMVYADITAPLYWWKEFDTYKVGTVANSCSSLYEWKLKPFELDDFSHEHLEPASLDLLAAVIDALNYCRNAYTNGPASGDKDIWWQMIQLLPSSYNQKRTVMLNYEVLAGIYPMRKDHKLDEWREFCKWIEGLPYSEIITCTPESEGGR